MGSLSIANPLSANYSENLKKRKLAWSHLLITLEGAPLALVEKISNGDPRDAWVALCDWYEPNSVEAFTQITRDLKNCTLENESDNSEVWMQQLDCYNATLSAIGSGNYSRNDIQMIGHIMSKLLTSYQPFITVFGI